MTPKSSSLLIATYNWPAALAVVLASVRAQRVLPSEVLIADDGSRDDTGELVAREADGFPVPLRHIRHDDAGFRLGTIRNKAMAASVGEYLIQIDGDLVLHPGFVSSHLAFARRGAYVQGSRAMLDEGRTAECLRAGRIVTTAWSSGVRNRVNALHMPLLSGLVRGPTDPLWRTRGCNMAFWREDIIRVNGYNEEIAGWGREDSELAARLQHSGIVRRNLKFSAVAWHLHHATRSQASLDQNHAIFEGTMRDRLVRCARGIDQWCGRDSELVSRSGSR
jgi:glycosyltransferase involved in cell wall biosynthesis